MARKSTNTRLNLLLKMAMVFALGVFITSCQRVYGEISSFSILSPDTYGEPFFILASEEQSSSAEFSQYTASVSKRLERKGWYRVMQASAAKYLVSFDYGISGSQTQQGSVPIYGHTGGGVTTHSGSFNTFGGGGFGSFGTYSGTSYTPSTWGVVGSQAYSYTTYQKYFRMRVTDAISEAPAYEVTVSSEDKSSVFGSVAECIFDFAFADFPKQQTSKTSVFVDECGLQPEQ